MAGFYDLATGLLRLLSPEAAHGLTIRALSMGLARPLAHRPPPALAMTAMGLAFSSPLGLAAGYDKNAEGADAMLGMGLGFVEVGTITRRPQPGNPKPRVFRLAADRAVINRLGFNSHGLYVVAARLRTRRSGAGVIGANVGPNRETGDPAGDCAACIQTLAPLADYIVLNVSSPNTPGLRGLQASEALGALIQAAQVAIDASAAGTPLLVKIAPDLDAGEREAIAAVALDRDLAGLIVGNTSAGLRQGLASAKAKEQGGLSGSPLFPLSTAVLADMHRLTRGRLTLIGVGGIGSGADAYAKIRAGASLTQLYTALIYSGPGLIARIHQELAGLLDRDGFASVAEAVGTAGAPT